MPTTLTDLERLLLANQYRILAAHHPEEYERAREIVVNGYEGDYDSLFNELLPPVPAAVCEEVVQVLELFRRLQFSYQDMPAAERDGINPADIKFRGFDGNHEGRHMDYAKFRLDQPNMWDESKSKDGFYNTHMPMLPGYRAMLARMKTIGWSRNLSAEQIRELVAIGKNAPAF